MATRPKLMAGQKKSTSRKQRRKEERKNKKYKKMMFLSKKFGHHKVENQDSTAVKVVKRKREKRKKRRDKELTYEDIRKVQLQEANKEEDRSIKRLEKMLKLNKRKKKNIPKSFCVDGLDYILELTEHSEDSKVPEFDMNVGDGEINDDLTKALGRHELSEDDEVSNSDQELSDSGSDGGNGEGFFVDKGRARSKFPVKLKQRSVKINDNIIGELGDDLSETSSESDTCNTENEQQKRTAMSERISNKRLKSVDAEDKSKFSSTHVTKKSALKNVEQKKMSETLPENKNKSVEKTVRFADEEPVCDNSVCESETLDCSETDSASGDDSSSSTEAKDYWEDIYGRLRDKEGKIVADIPKGSAGKYVPPAKRALPTSSDAKKQETQMRIHKQMRGLLNKLNESNMRHISDQIENLYMQHSRNDMNEALVFLVQQSVVLPYLAPEKLVMEHALLITVLHCNVGSEVGAHCLQNLATTLNTKLQDDCNTESGKEIDNLLLLLCHMYTFKVTHNQLIYDIMKKLTERFLEKDLELILLILRSVGFSLRKDDPLALKSVILSLQNKAASASHLVDQSRIRFMLDTLMAIRNNNMQKIPNYNPSLAEHLRKSLKTFQRKGTYIQELHISLDDLLKAEERGRWWIVGSAWQGKSSSEEPGDDTHQPSVIHQFSEEVLELAQKQHMNTEVRKNIFCVLISAEDYMDAFEKLLRLGLKNQQDREIIHVTLHCCLQEKEFNLYYSYLMEKFCTFDRRYQMVLQFAVWDRFKEMRQLKPFQVTNLAKCLVHLFTKNALPLSVLKTIQLSEMDKTLVKFLRQLLLAILLHESDEVCHHVFLRVAPAQKLHSMREGLRLFMLHFLLRNQSKLESHVASKLKERVDLAITAMNSAENAQHR